MGFFSFINKQLPAIGTLLVIASFGLIYFLIYLPQNERTIREQRFRALQNLDRNIQDKIENSKKLLENLLSHYPADSTVTEGYIEKFKTDKFILTPIKTIRKDSSDNFKSQDSCHVTVDTAANKVILFCRNLRSPKDSSYYEITMSFPFEQFFGSLLSLYGDIFDHFVVIRNKTAIFQDFPAGISEMDEDSLLDGKGGIHVSSLHDMAVGGTDYKIFSQPINIGDRITVNGLVSNHRYQREKKQLPTQIILSLIILVVVIILLFPWIKLVHMGSKDRLTLWDAIATLSASMLLMSFLFLSFLNYNSHFTVETRSTQNEFLADTINKSFQAEIRDTYNRLKSFDTARRRDNLYDQKASYLKVQNNTITALDSKLNPTTTVSDDSITALENNHAIKYAYWLDSTGDEKSLWTTDSILVPHGNYKERPYFRKIKDDNPYFLSNAEKYYLDQIVSWITGDFRSVISIRSVNKDVTVAAVTFDMESLKDMVLPPGFLFAMVTDSGKVLYHSESFRNLNENLLDEFSSKDKLRSSLIAHKTSSFRTDYFSNPYSVYVKPIVGLPYFIVIMEDMAYEQTRDTNVFSFSLSMLFFFLLFLTLQTLTVYLVAPKKSFFKKQLFDATWIGPKKSNRIEYIVAGVFNIVLIVLLIILIPLTSFLAYTFILLFSAISSPLFLNYLYAIKYKSKNYEHYSIKRKIVTSLIVIMIVTDLASFFLLDGRNIFILLTCEFIVFVFSYLIYSKARNSLDKSGEIQNKINDLIRKTYADVDKLKSDEPRIRKKVLLKQLSLLIVKTRKLVLIESFPLMALTRLIITSGIPIVFFYISSYNFEKDVSIRNRQSLFLNNVAGKMVASDNQTIDSLKGVYFDGALIQSPVKSTDSLKNINFQVTDEQKRTKALLKQFRLPFTDESVSEQDFDGPISDDLLFFYSDFCKTLFETNNVTYRKESKPGKHYLRVEAAANLNYPFPMSGRFREDFLFFILLASALGVFFIIIRGIIRKMFALQVPDLTRAARFDCQLLKDPDLNRLVFVVGPPGAGKTNLIRKMVDNKIIKSTRKKDLFFYPAATDNRAIIADMIHIPDSSNDEQDKKEWSKHSKTIFNEKNKLIVVNHFEYNIQDPATNRTKLNFLERLMLDDQRKIIILSTIHPVAFLDSAFFDSNKQSSATGKKNKNNDESKSEKTMPEDLERWHVLLGHYNIVLMKLNESPLVANDKSEKINPRVGDNGVKAMIDRETQWGHFLNKMRRGAIVAARASNWQTKDDSPSGDEWAFKMQTTSYYFYMYVWQSLTREEKFLLYDLAEDNLVNSSDDYTLSMLIGKGLIIRDDDTLKIFNDGFRNFILTAIGNTEAMKIKDQIRENGYWAKLKTPLRIIIVAILAFVLASQEESYTKLIAYFTALAGGIPLILRVFSLFGKGSQQSS